MASIYAILQKIGFDWQVALANLVNFLIILFILKKFAFKPIKKIIEDRQDKINEGLLKAEEADTRIKEVNTIVRSKIKAADLESINIIKNTEQKAKHLEQLLRKEAEDKQKEMMRQIQLDYARQKAAIEQLVSKEASELVKKFIIKTVKLKPDQIDESLIKQAVLEAEK